MGPTDQGTNHQHGAAAILDVSNLETHMLGLQSSFKYMIAEVFKRRGVFEEPAARSMYPALDRGIDCETTFPQGLPPEQNSQKYRFSTERKLMV